MAAAPSAQHTTAAVLPSRLFSTQANAMTKRADTAKSPVSKTNSAGAPYRDSVSLRPSSENTIAGKDKQTQRATIPSFWNGPSSEMRWNMRPDVRAERLAAASRPAVDSLLSSEGLAVVSR